MVACLIVGTMGRAEEFDRGDYMSTQHFGPNAFPVPDMLDGRVSPTMKIELAGDGYIGYDKDYTADLFARLYIPLFTPRVNLTVWMPVVEGYWLSDGYRKRCYVADTLGNGVGAGDVYISTDIQVLRARKWWPDIAIRAAMKTASGAQTEWARYYDDPAYWFDIALGKSWYMGHDKDWEFRIAATTGFLCWQTKTSSQNDAVQYGAQILLKHKWMSGRITYNGYSGWQKNGDEPMVIKAELRGYAKGFEPFACYQAGLRDYPYHLIRVGLAYNVDILAAAKKKIQEPTHNTHER